MKFDLSEIKVKAGQKVKLTLRHNQNLNSFTNVSSSDFLIKKSYRELV